LIKKIKEKKITWVKIQGFLRKYFWCFDYLIFWKKDFLTNGKKLYVKRNGKA